MAFAVLFALLALTGAGCQDKDDSLLLPLPDDRPLDLTAPPPAYGTSLFKRIRGRRMPDVAREHVALEGSPLLVVRRWLQGKPLGTWIAVYDSGLAYVNGRCIRLSKGELAMLRTLLDSPEFRSLAPSYGVAQSMSDGFDDRLIADVGTKPITLGIAGGGLLRVGHKDAPVLHAVADRLATYRTFEAQTSCWIGQWRVSAVPSDQAATEPWPDSWPPPRSGQRLQAPGVVRPWITFDLPHDHHRPNESVLDYQGQAWRTIIWHDIPGLRPLLVRADAAESLPTISSRAFENTRLAGSLEVTPSPAVAATMGRKSPVVHADYRVCISPTGDLSSTQTKPSGHPAWDREIEAAIARWRHEPDMSQGYPRAACSRVGFFHHPAR